MYTCVSFILQLWLWWLSDNVQARTWLLVRKCKCKPEQSSKTTMILNLRCQTKRYLHLLQQTCHTRSPVQAPNLPSSLYRKAGIFWGGFHLVIDLWTILLVITHVEYSCCSVVAFCLNLSWWCARPTPCNSSSRLFSLATDYFMFFTYCPRLQERSNGRQKAHWNQKWTSHHWNHEYSSLLTQILGTQQ